MRRRELLASASLGAIAGCTIGGEPPDTDSFRLSMPTLDGKELPRRYTCDGEGVSPPLRVEGIPEQVVSLAIVGEWLRGYTPQTIWILWGIAADGSIELPADIPNERRIEQPIDAVQGRNDERSIGYRPPCHETPDHQEYRFIAYALPDQLDLDPGADRDTFDSEIETGLSDVSSTTLRVRYGRFTDPSAAG
jgi:Raf kinase inhibitor-like YbhB/YbcL family protein